MKRVKAACICQTLHFMLKEDTPSEFAKQLVRQDVKRYYESLERSHTLYKLISEEEQPDGSVMVRIIKQYNASPVGDYLK